MKVLLLPLLAALILPTAVNAEKITLTEDQFHDSLLRQMWWGKMMVTCDAAKLGYLTNSQRDNLNQGSINFHKQLHNDKSTYKKTVKTIMSYMDEDYPGCIPLLMIER